MLDVYSYIMNISTNNQEDNPMLNEEWKEIPDLPYEINKNGTVRRLENFKVNWKKNTEVKPYINPNGYLCIHLYKNSKCYRFLIHRLIAQAFIPNPENKPCINHIDGNPLNNSINNLEWCTHQENMIHANKTGLVKANRTLTQRVKNKGSSSKYWGVSWAKDRNKWAVLLTWKKKKYPLGRFIDEIEAAKAYDNKVKEMGLHLQGCPLNFP